VGGAILASISRQWTRLDGWGNPSIGFGTNRIGKTFKVVPVQSKENGMPKDAHNKAAEHHENAAKSHKLAADHHGKGDHTKGREESSKAKTHSKTAHDHSEMADDKSRAAK
jgi:hypothetical protein